MDGLAETPVGPKDDGLFFYSSYAFELFGEKTRKEKLTFLSGFQQACSSPELIHFAKTWGLVNPTLELNARACAGNAVHDRFVAACVKLPDIATLAIVFHGTREDNIPHILKRGLDPKKRKRQNFGAGEYFSPDPGLSTSYCGAGRKTLVFVVVVPYTSSYSHAGIIVVPTSEHQLSLGVVSFDAAFPAALSNFFLWTKLNGLSEKVRRASKKAAVAKVKAVIIRSLFKEGIAAAAKVYSKNVDCFDGLVKREISMYAHRLYDDSVTSCFPNLPPPMSLDERDTAAICTVDRLEEKLMKAKRKLNRKRRELFSRRSRTHQVSTT